MMKPSKILVYLDIAAPLIALVIGVLFFLFKKRKMVLSDRVILVFLAVEVILNTLSNVLQNNLINNHWVYHLNGMVTQSLFTFYFFRSLHSKRFVMISFLFFVSFWFVNMMWIQSYSTFNSYSYAAGVFLIVVYALINFKEIIDELPMFAILELKDFWMLAGILTYFGSCFFIFSSYNYLSAVSPGNVGILWKTHNIFLAAGCILFFKAIDCKQWIRK